MTVPATVQATWMLEAGTVSPVMVQVIEPAFTTTLPAVPPWGGTGGVTTIWPKVVRASRNKACFMRLLIFWFANAEAISGARSIVREVFILAFPFPAAHSHTLD